MYSEDDYLLLSGIQHFAFCRRQWALIHIEQQWVENYRTVDGNLMHQHVHNPDFHEKRGDVVITRGMAVASPRLGISGECDAVEFRRSSEGITLFGQEGRFSVTPIEYKRGSPKEDECDVLQLAAQAICLEEMLCCDIPYGYLYYGETRHRVKVEITVDVRSRVEAMVQEMHQLFNRSHMPKVKRSKACNACSLKDICLPVICGGKKASDYVKSALELEEV